MLLDRINLNNLRIFEAVFRCRSMTQAAQELHLTQSGISQHIKSLEEALELKLFDRIRQKLVPTAQGATLYKQVSLQLKTLEETLLEVTAKDQLLRGEVHVGVPIVFGTNMIIPLMSQLSKDHPDLHFRLHFELAKVSGPLLLSGTLDFAFVDDFPMDGQIKTQKIYDEVLQLCCSKSYLKRVEEKQPFSMTKEFFENKDYVAYEKGEPVVRNWLAFHLKKTRQIFLNSRVVVADAMGVSEFIKGGLGFGVLPGHHVKQLVEQGEELFVVPTTRELKNKISLATVAHRSHSPAVKEALSFIMEGLKK